MKENLRSETRHNIWNNLELTEDLNKLKIKNNNKLISLDVTKMLGEISRKRLLELFRFNRYHGHPQGLKYAKIVKEIMNQNYCRLNNMFYKPPRGLAMGSPIPPILTEIFMHDFENGILNFPSPKAFIQGDNLNHKFCHTQVSF